MLSVSWLSLLRAGSAMLSSARSTRPENHTGASGPALGSISTSLTWQEAPRVCVVMLGCGQQGESLPPGHLRWARARLSLCSPEQRQELTSRPVPSERAVEVGGAGEFREQWVSTSSGGRGPRLAPWESP